MQGQLINTPVHFFVLQPLIISTVLKVKMKVSYLNAAGYNTEHYQVVIGVTPYLNATDNNTKQYQVVIKVAAYLNAVGYNTKQYQVKIGVRAYLNATGYNAETVQVNPFILAVLQVKSEGSSKTALVKTTALSLGYISFSGVWIYLFICFTQYSRILHLYDSSQHYGGRKLGTGAMNHAHKYFT